MQRSFKEEKAKQKNRIKRETVGKEFMARIRPEVSWKAQNITMRIYRAASLHFKTDKNPNPPPYQCNHTPRIQRDIPCLCEIVDKVNAGINLQKLDFHPY